MTDEEIKEFHRRRVEIEMKAKKEHERLRKKREKANANAKSEKKAQDAETKSIEKQGDQKVEQARTVFPEDNLSV